VQTACASCIEVLEAMTAVAGSGRVGMRICPGNPFNDLHDPDPAATFAALLDPAPPTCSWPTCT
jgi:N-ethylmaleimide reductase